MFLPVFAATNDDKKNQTAARTPCS